MKLLPGWKSPVLGITRHHGDHEPETEKEKEKDRERMDGVLSTDRDTCWPEEFRLGTTLGEKQVTLKVAEGTCGVRGSRW